MYLRRYLFIFSMLMLFGVTSYALAYVLYVFGSIKASRKIHKQLMESITGTTLRYYFYVIGYKMDLMIG